jgi:hypothetical protein
MALAVALLIAGCSGDVPLDIRVQRCLDTCETGRSCPGADGSIDCYSICDDLDGINRATDCWRPYDELYDCMDRKGVCGAGESCAGQQATYRDCIADNCSSDPDREECAL